tara:strand:+ start:2294 stop:2728 length:435 start_codon:yes stop_codon:yes gene_type:complete
MNRILYLFFIILCLAILIIPVFSSQTVIAENFNKKDEKALDDNKKRKKFLLEMKKLLNAAIKSGFSDKEVREITVVRNGKVLYVWDFLEQEKLRLEREELSKKKSKRLDRYLTVMDISDELESYETKNLDIIKEKSIFVGAEQK